MLENYLHMFENLRTDRGRDRYPEFTYHRAPHKPFLLLSVMDLIAQGRITENLVEPSFELVDTFNTYWAAIIPPGSTNMANQEWGHHIIKGAILIILSALGSGRTKTTMTRWAPGRKEVKRECRPRHT